MSGLDDLFIGICRAVTGIAKRKKVSWPPAGELDAAPERRIAILVPLWREHGVIGKMLERTVASLRYHGYDIFVGVYPNDHLTVRAVNDAARLHPRIHAVLLPHAGPTSKGDCLNWAFRGMQRHEERTGGRYEVIVTHDAEDVVHPESLRIISWFATDHAMVQVPVLALATPGHEMTHGVYCDEFAEYQQKDVPVRQAMGGFLPSNGVGCGFERTALDRLAASRGGQVFDPSSLTEDYENGFLLHAMGYRQIFVPVRFQDGAPLATREYFPQSWGAAVRQRSRWIAGITLQGWERHGWRAPWWQCYWLWRDRKGLVGNLLSPVATLAYGYCAWNWQPLTAEAPWMPALCTSMLCVAALQIGMRTWASRRIYGWKFAALTPLRAVWGNAINFQATLKALGQFASARSSGAALRWHKTEHSFPAHAAAAPGRQRLGEVLIRMRCVESREIEAALQTLPPGRRLGEHLMHLRKLSQDDLYQALSSQTGIPLGAPAENEVDRMAARMLPARTAQRWRVLPYRVSMGQLHLATTEAPSAEMLRELTEASPLDLRFRLIPPEEFRKLAELTS